MMKKNYNPPKIHVIALQDEDIISTSTGEFDGEWVVINANRSEGQIL